MNIARVEIDKAAAGRKDFDAATGCQAAFAPREMPRLTYDTGAGVAPAATGRKVFPQIDGLLKEYLDFCGSFCLLVLFSPVFLIVAALVKLDSRGPVFFFQRRCGKGGREFPMLKFRTMVENAELLKKHLQNEVDGPMFKVARDPRVTRVGRYLRVLSLDELPQLLNVLRGEMSLVGPRPLAREEMGIDSTWMAVRLSVKPGLTGLWQIKARESRKFSDWVAYDLDYVANRSFLKDIKILLLTIPAVIGRRGAS
jgi:lipopolysaccharide/colanic/teichoic acid biosynthesis glycosyltransferase